MRTTRTTRLFLLLALATATGPAHADIFQFRSRVPAGADNPLNVGSYTATSEDRNDLPGVSFGHDIYDQDFAAFNPNDKSLVVYAHAGPNHKIADNFTPELDLGNAITSYLSFKKCRWWHYKC
jgi:hypothetical protein